MSHAKERIAELKRENKKKKEADGSDRKGRGKDKQKRKKRSFFVTPKDRDVVSRTIIEKSSETSDEKEPIAPESPQEDRGLQLSKPELPFKFTMADVLAARRELARRYLVDYSKSIVIPGAPMSDEAEEKRFKSLETGVAHHHVVIMQAIQRCLTTEYGRLMIFAPPGSAKALALDTPIPTPTGWSLMGDLKVGDKVFDENGIVCNVTWVSQIHRDRPVYKVRTDCGDEIIADQDHEWLVRLCGKPRNGGRPLKEGRKERTWSPFKIKETHELCRPRLKRAMIKRAGALELSDIDLPLDPYVLGVWLGDGDSSNGAVTSSVEDQTWLRAEIERLGYQTKTRTIKTKFGISDIRKHLVALGLLLEPFRNIKGRKHIPSIYMRASVNQRLSLLQGLVDTDGTVCKKRGCTTFCNTNIELAEQFRELVRSLSFKAGWSVSRAVLNGKDCGPAYKVSFYSSKSARMPRKAKLCRDQYRTPNTYIDVVPAGIADTVCIEVDSPSHLFLCGKSMTPTHNSSYASVVATTWAMGRKPGTRVLMTSYAATPIIRHSKRARQIAGSREFRDIFGASLIDGSKAADEWELTNGSGMFAAGLLGGLTSSRADFGVIDDPVAGREEADSETIQQKTMQAYEDDFLTRLKPKAPIILIQTRWSENDLAGKILPEDYDGESGSIKCRDGQTWEVLCIPAQCERKDDPLGRKIGEYLWPEWFDRQHWSIYEAKPRTWSALYQQRPAPAEGVFFKREWFRRFRLGSEPKHMHKYLASDHAPAGEEDSDFTCCRVWGVDSLGDLYLLDGFRHQETMDKSIERILGEKKKKVRGLIQKHKPLCWFPEDDNNWKSVEGFVKKMMREEGVYCRIEPMSPHGRDKATKAQPFQGMASSGRVWIPEGSEGDDIISQYLKFPAGKNDDEVDVAGVIGRALGDVVSGVVPVIVKERKRDVYEKSFDEDEEGKETWKTA